MRVRHALAEAFASIVLNPLFFVAGGIVAVAIWFAFPFIALWHGVREGEYILTIVVVVLFGLGPVVLVVLFAMHVIRVVFP